MTRTLATRAPLGMTWCVKLRAVGSRFVTLSGAPFGAQSKRVLAIAAILFATLTTAPPAFAATPIVQPTIGGAPWTTAQIAKLQGDLDAMLANDSALHGAHYGVYAIDTASGAPLYAHAADDEIQPASTLKLLIGSAALDRLGPNLTFTTQILISPDKRVLVLRAGGDPFLTTNDLELAAKAVATSASYAGSIVVDDRRFSTEPYPRGWTWDDFGQAYAPRISAIALDEDLVQLIVAPGARIGSRPDVATQAPIALSIGESSSATDRMALCTRSWSGGRVSVSSRALTGAAGTDDTLDVRLTADGCPEIVGSIPLGASADTLDLAVPDVPGYAASVLTTYVDRVPAAPIVRSIDRSDPQARIDDATIPLWSHTSATMAQWLGPRFWIPSDNLVGEMLLREVGFAAAGKPGTTENGIAYERTWLQSIGVDPASVTLADGCGMSQYDRITPRDLVAILQHDWNGPNRQLVLDSLPVGGARGTIEGIAGTDAAGRVFAKTGSMMHVRGLAGYLTPLRHGAVTFAFQVDDWNGSYPALAALRARVLSRIVDD